ncbi:MAG TPA: hypothetical protein VM143_13750 [Acidimicrobiales bacterium]|nr:hypothetical protein [Acidimicrobiales bacterium]
MTRPVRDRLAGGRLAALGTAGAVVAHMLAYAVAEPDGHQRASLLHDTGHAYWHAAIAAAVVAGSFSLVSHAVAQFREARGYRRSAETIGRAGVRLAVFQVAVYAIMEFAERAAAHEPVARLFAHHIFVIGVALQVLVAATLVQLLRLVGRAAVAVAKRLAVPRLPRRAPQTRYLAIAYVGRYLATWDRPGPSRAPPALV